MLKHYMLTLADTSIAEIETNPTVPVKFIKLSSSPSSAWVSCILVKHSSKQGGRRELKMKFQAALSQIWQAATASQLDAS